MNSEDMIYSTHDSERRQRGVSNAIDFEFAASRRIHDAANEWRCASDIRSMIMASALRFASRPALRLGMRVYTYAELCHAANKLASLFTEAHGGTPRRVGILASHSETSYAGVMACLYAGSTFVPLNPRFPVDRTRNMLEQADLDVLLVDAESLSLLLWSLPRLRRVPMIITPGTDTTLPMNVPDSCRIFTQRNLAAAQAMVHFPSISGAH